MGKKCQEKQSVKFDLVELFGEQEENIEITAQSLKVLSHPARLRIMCALSDAEQTVQNLEY